MDDIAVEINRRSESAMTKDYNVKLTQCHGYFLPYVKLKGNLNQICQR